MAAERRHGQGTASGRRAAAGRPLAAPGIETRRLLSRLQLVVTRRLRGLVQGEHLGLFPGPGTEPGESRVYVPGDDVRLIDWNVTARTGELHVCDPVADHEVDLWLLVDVSASQHFGTSLREKREVVVGLAAAFGLPATRLANRVGAVVVGGGEVLTVPPATGRKRLLALLRRVLATPAWEGEGRTDLAAALGRLERLARRRSVVVVISDFLSTPGWEAALGRLGTRHELVVAEVVDPRELELPRMGILALVDPETGRSRVVDTSRAGLRSAFARAAGTQRAAVATAVARAGADHLVVSTDADWLGEALAFFARRTRRRAYRAAPSRTAPERTGGPS
ncbi:MAG TPA: DUF58 domain-containing protein [Acidimicrobiia bacterium]|nr:DUF58 domain-containing protein [Acidimicrobiia bacterium]